MAHNYRVFRVSISEMALGRYLILGYFDSLGNGPSTQIWMV